MMRVGAWMLAASIVALACVDAAAAGPSVRKIAPRGLQAGATTTLVIEGAGLSGEPRVLAAGVPIARQAVKPGASAGRVEIEVTLEPSATAGVYLLRLATNEGVSSGEPIAVSSLAETVLAPHIDSLPAAVSGVISGSAVQRVSFAGRAGQKITVDVMARRLGAEIDPVLRLLDARGRQIAWSPGLRAIAGDARAQCVLPADGEYRVELHDSLYRAGEQGPFRICVGELNYADFVFPLAVERGHAMDLELVSTSIVREQAHVSFAAGPYAGSQPANWPAGVANISGSRPGVTTSEYPTVVESVTADGACELPAAPVVVSARFAKAKAAGLFRLPVVAGQKLRVEVVSEQLGLPVDAVLSVENEKGSQLATNDDRASTKDPAVEVTVPAATEKLIIKTRDLYGAGGEDHLYQLLITPLDRPDFSLSLSRDVLQASPGGAGVVRVMAQRAGYEGLIRLVAEGLPAGCTLWPVEIPASRDQALIAIASAADSPAGSSAATIISLRGESVGVDPPIERFALAPDRPAFRLQPWLRGQLAAESTTPGPLLELAWAPWSEGATLVPGGKLAVEVEIKRAAGASGPVRVNLETSQSPPKKAAKAKKGEKPAEAAARLLRLAEPIMIPANQSSGRGELVAPADLEPQSYDVALVAELLSNDKKTVLGSIATPVRRASTGAPMKLELSGPAEAEGRAGRGEAGRFSGKIVRAAGFSAPVKIQLVGLPKDVVSPSVTIAGDASEFALPLAFGYGLKAGPLLGAKLVAMTQDPQNPLIAAQSNEIPVKLTIVAGERPDPSDVLVLFEDQPEFIGAKPGKEPDASLETGQKFSGSASCKVLLSQRFMYKLPDPGVKIRENPGPGEYRYLQYAWLKKDGENICFQLIHEGTWGPTPKVPTGFRYHVGSAPDCFGASLRIADQLPTEFTLVTRDLFADFGEFTLNGVELSPVDGEYALFDHICLSRSLTDFEHVNP